MTLVRRSVEIEYVVLDEASDTADHIATSVKAAGDAAQVASQQVERSAPAWQRLGSTMGTGAKFIREHSGELLTATRGAVKISAQVSDAAATTEDSLFAIRTAYKDTAEDWIAWSQKMQAVTTASDEAFQESAVGMRTLISAYGLTTEQTRELIAASADLAAVKRIDLYDAAMRVQAAIRGEAESAEYLGLTLNDTFMANLAFEGSLKDTWGTLTDTEKAQYRYKEILNQTTYAQGAAAEATKTSTGQYQQLKNAIQDQVAAIGQAINKSGPWLKALEDGLGFIDMLVPLYSALKLAKLADTKATIAHTAAQISDNAAVTAGAGAVEGLAGSIGGTGGLTAAAGAAGVASSGLVVVLGELALALAAVAAGAWVTKEAVAALNEANYETGDSAAIAAHQIDLARQALKEGSISYDEFVKISRDAAQIMGDTPTKTTAMQDGFLNVRTELEMGTRAAGDYQTKIQGIGLQVGGLPPWPYKGVFDAEVAGMEAQKKAYYDLQQLPAQRAEAHKRWTAIILEAAKRSDDERVQSARAALAAENSSWQAHLTQRQATLKSFNAEVAAEEKRIADLRKAGAWETAWYAERELETKKAQFTQTFGDDEAALSAHNARKTSLNEAYWETIRTTSDHNLLLQVERYDAEIRKLGELEEGLKTTMATGETAVEGFGKKFSTVSGKVWEDAVEDIDMWDDELDKVLDKKRYFVIEGVYLPPALPGGGGGEGTPKHLPEGAQYGRVYTGERTIRVAERGRPEAVLPLDFPARVAQLLRPYAEMGGGGGPLVHVEHVDSALDIEDLAYRVAEVIQERSL